MGEFAESKDETPFSRAKDGWDAASSGGQMVIEAMHPTEMDLPLPRELAGWNKALTGMQLASGVADIGGGVQDLSLIHI